MKMTKQEVIENFAAYATRQVFEAFLNVGRQSEVFQKGFHRKFLTEYKASGKEQRKQIKDAFKVISNGLQEEKARR